MFCQICYKTGFSFCLQLLCLLVLTAFSDLQEGAQLPLLYILEGISVVSIFMLNQLCWFLDLINIWISEMQ